MKIEFTKMHGAGNDFVVLDGRGELPADLAELSRRMCRRRFGIGADQVLIVYDSDEADYRMDIYNADGGRVEMCGNGIRAFHKYLVDRAITDKRELTVETLAGIIKPVLTDAGTDTVRVDMGPPILDAQKIPTTGSGRLVAHPLEVEGVAHEITCVSMGNPHAVLFVPSTADAPVTTLGPKIENHPFFPARINVEFIQVLSRTEANMRVWERGSGETWACGTGASAALVAAVLNDLLDRDAVLHLKGGDLRLEWPAADASVFMTGPAAEVFSGVYEF